MSPSASAQARVIDSTATGPFNQSASFSAHLKRLQRTLPLRSRYENFIGGKWIAPVKGGYFDNVSPTTGQVICQIAALAGRRCRAGHRCGACRRRELGPHRRGGARARA